ncbi:MAG: phosphoribosyltransferase family protein [Nanoarchaeota archaeon]|nr:phosphoribosyltransferase family protein [Nanoarchaeota archaeon]
MAALEKYRNKNALVLAIPKGGIEVAYETAKYLNAGFSVLIARKLPYPDNPEAGFGAIAEDGRCFVFPDVEQWLSKESIANQEGAEGRN